MGDGAARAARAIRHWLFRAYLDRLIHSPPCPVARSPGWRVTAAGAIGGLAPMDIVFLLRGAPGHPVMRASNCIILGPTLASLWIVLWLGRSFSILPQARRLATYDPYRFVRHQLFVPEFLALLGLAWLFAVTWLLSLWDMAAAAQFPRM